MTRERREPVTAAEVDPRVQARLNAYLREPTLPRYLAARTAMISTSGTR